MDGMKIQVLVLAAKQWEMEDGRKGVSVTYLETTDLSPKINGPDSYGYFPAKVSIPVHQLKDVCVVPAIYDCYCKPTVKSGKMTLGVDRFEYVCNVDGATK